MIINIFNFIFIPRAQYNQYYQLERQHHSHLQQYP